MKSAAEWLRILSAGTIDPFLSEMYGKNSIEEKKSRIAELLQTFDADRQVAVFSAPGRTELGGNHTDHNHGRVLAGGIHLDSIAVAARRDDFMIRLESEGYETPFDVDLHERAARSEESGRTESLIRGIAARMQTENWKIGGFDARMTSNVLPGSGLSSSASVEVLIGAIYNHLYNDDQIQAVDLAKMGQYAENEYFGKPCGLMDQTACAVGGIVSIDFRDPGAPVVEALPFDFSSAGYALVVVDTGGNHADLTPEYAAVPTEMKKVAAFFGKSTCREITEQMVFEELPAIRKFAGDRAVLRSLHFFAENDRVPEQIEALRQSKIERYLELVQESGDSSWRLLQNCVSTQNPTEQGITIALTATADFLQGTGAARVHGGGFAGTIQAYIPEKHLEEYTRRMERIFNSGCVTRLRIRPQGVVALPTS